MQATLQKSNRKDKRYMVQLQTPDGNRTIHFGSPRHDNFTTHKDPKRRELYIARHMKRERWDDPTTPGFWSRWLLWEEPHLLDAMKSLERKGVKLQISKIK